MITQHTVTHDWVRVPFFGGVLYYCQNCGLNVEGLYSPTETEASSGVKSLLAAYIF